MAIEQVSEKNPQHLRSIWLCCAYPVLAQGLTGMLENEARVHQAEEPPENMAPSCIVFCVQQIEDVRSDIKRLQSLAPGVPMLAFSFSNDLSFARAVLEAGARGFIHAGMTAPQIARAISVASDGEVAVSRDLLKDLVMGAPSVDLSVLTPRQREILQLVVEGRSNSQIGKELFLSESTVKQHLRSAYKALKVRNRTEAARLLRERI